MRVQVHDPIATYDLPSEALRAARLVAGERHVCSGAWRVTAIEPVGQPKRYELHNGERRIVWSLLNGPDEAYAYGAPRGGWQLAPGDARYDALAARWRLLTPFDHARATEVRLTPVPYDELCRAVRDRYAADLAQHGGPQTFGDEARGHLAYALDAIETAPAHRVVVWLDELAFECLVATLPEIVKRVVADESSLDNARRANAILNGFRKLVADYEEVTGESWPRPSRFEVMSARLPRRAPNERY
jgi:hypothetical protein